MPVILVGDYNIVPTELDAHKPESWVKDAVFFPETRALFQKLLKQGWIDSIRLLYPDKKIFTYWDYFRNAFNRDAGIRMDHLLLSPNLKKRLKKAAFINQEAAYKALKAFKEKWG